MKASASAQKAVEAHLQALAAKDSLFAETLKKPNKNIKGCLHYIMGQAKKTKSSMVTDDEVFGWAVHYYDEDSIKDVAPVNGEMTTGEATSELIQTTSKSEAPKKLKKGKAEILKVQFLSKQEALF